MPAINIHELLHLIPRFRGRAIEPNTSFLLPYLARLKLTGDCLELEDRAERVQRFRIVWIRTGAGRHRPLLVCSGCGRRTTRVFAKYEYGTYACRHCHRALYASQKYDQDGRKRLAASKLRLRMGGLPDIEEPIPPKRKRQHKRTYRAARKTLEQLEAPIKGHRFKKPLATRLFAYHVA
jgi:hypothetical protein